MFVDRKNRVHALAALCGLALTLPGCGDPYEPPFPAPQFQLTDINPSSDTFGESLTPKDAEGKVLLIYFVSFG